MRTVLSSPKCPVLSTVLRYSSVPIKSVSIVLRDSDAQMSRGTRAYFSISLS